jgi:hypothetical protein
MHTYKQAREMQKIQGMTEELVMERSKVNALEAALLKATTAHAEEMVALRRETEQHKTRNARLTADMEEMHELMGLVDLSAVSGGGGGGGGERDRT